MANDDSTSGLGAVAMPVGPLTPRAINYSSGPGCAVDVHPPAGPGQSDLLSCNLGEVDKGTSPLLQSNIMKYKGCKRLPICGITTIVLDTHLSQPVLALAERLLSHGWDVQQGQDGRQLSVARASRKGPPHRCIIDGDGARDTFQFWPFLLPPTRLLLHRFRGHFGLLPTKVTFKCEK